MSFGRLAMLLVLLLGGCALIQPELPATDLSAPKWMVRSGQAVWQPAQDGAPRLLGDLVMAESDDGELYLSFTKAPLPLFTARRWGWRWAIRFVEEQRSYGGYGPPPRGRFIWFALPDIVAGEAPPPGWEVETVAPHIWQLRQPKTGESLRVVLLP